MKPGCATCYLLAFIGVDSRLAWGWSRCRSTGPPVRRHQLHRALFNREWTRMHANRIFGDKELSGLEQGRETVAMKPGCATCYLLAFIGVDSRLAWGWSRCRSTGPPVRRHQLHRALFNREWT